MEPALDNVMLVEQAYRLVFLEPGDLTYISELKFQVEIGRVQPTDGSGDSIACRINPGARVGHFQLPSHRIVIIEPKVNTASILRMLAYVFTDDHRNLLRVENVKFAADTPIFEPLVEFFNKLVSERASRGLAQDYIQREENLGMFRGALNVKAHLQKNLDREDRIHCRFYEQTVDIPDNRLVKRTLHHLLQIGGWTPRTSQSLVQNFHQFDSVVLEPSGSETPAGGHYHRLNDDYRPIHELCRMFLKYSSISEGAGAIRFRGILLNMNVLFEQFVEKAFQKAVKMSRLTAQIQNPTRLSFSAEASDIRPDITIQRGTQVTVVVDAKYKKDEGGPQSPDIYQVIAYGTVLQCHHVYLLYPKTELDSERDIAILNSPIVVKARRVDISSPQAVEAAECLARAVVFAENAAEAVQGAA